MPASRTRRQPRAPGQPDWNALKRVKEATQKDAAVILVERMKNGDYRVLVFRSDDQESPMVRFTA